MRGAALLYCSDDPINHIGAISKKDFDIRAMNFDTLMHKYAVLALEKTA
jgi:hypothetical protein